ncbi:MAG: hypothetical protein STSR0002_01180 [Smithella sp.]|jgi:hypothetical protein
MKKKISANSKNKKQAKAATKKKSPSVKSLLPKKIERKKTKPEIKDAIPLKTLTVKPLKREEAERYRNMVENIADGYFEVDLAGNFTFFNDAVCRVLGYSREELMGQNYHQHTDKETAKKVFQTYNKVYKTGKIIKEFGYYIIRKDGFKRYIEGSVSLRRNSSGKPIGFLGITNDLTERKRAEEALKERDIVFKKLSANVPGIIYQFQMKPDGSFCLPFSTDAVKDIYGCSPEDIVNDFSPIAKAVYHEDFDRFVESIKLSAKKMSPWQCEYRVQVPGKPLRWILGTSTPEKLPDGSIIWHGFNTDITESKKAEKELEKYREHLEDLVRERTIKLEASNKELEAFSYSASHDLRAPLRSIEGFSQALLEDYRDKLDIQGKDYLTRIKTATRRMADLIEDMLQLSRITRMEMNIEKVNLTLIARSVMSELQKSQPQRHVEISIADSLEDTADLRLMRIVLDNLLSNAWKFTERQAKAKIEFGLLKSEVGEKVYFIRDNGAGFDMAYSDKLFAPFQRLHADDEFPGTGIGLATVRRIINRHGGKVWAEGEIDKGATFYFSLNEK